MRGREGIGRLASCDLSPVFVPLSVFYFPFIYTFARSCIFSSDVLSAFPSMFIFRLFYLRLSLGDNLIAGDADEVTMFMNIPFCTFRDAVFGRTGLGGGGQNVHRSRCGKSMQSTRQYSGRL